MKRAARLQSAKSWLATYRGKRLVRGYARWFGVDLLCAAKELELLGVDLSEEYLDALRRSVHGCRKRRKPSPPEDPSEDLLESDEHFVYIAGHTSGGLPFGVPWDEWPPELGE